MRVVQLAPGSELATPAAEEAALYHQAFLDWGWKSEIYVSSSIEDESSDGKMQPQIEPADLLVLHFCNIAPAAELPDHPAERTVVILHQLLPPFLVPHCQPQTGRFRQAEEQLRSLAAGCPLAIGHTVAACNRLEQLGFSRIRRLPYLADAEPLSVEPDPVLLKMVTGESPLLFFDGDIHGGANLEDLVRTVWFCRNFTDPGVRLVVAGSTDLCPACLEPVSMVIEEYGIEKEAVVFTGSLSAAELGACLRAADIFIQFSGYDWNGARLLRALNAGIPAVAFAEAAPAEILGDAGILLSDTINSSSAEVIHRLLDDPDWRERVISRQRDRLETFSPDAITLQLRSHLARFDDLR